ncbi:MAG: hypothetical protein ABGX31_06795 [bacterium]
MIFTTTEPLKIDINGEVQLLNPGDIFDFPDDRAELARPYVEKGILREIDPFEAGFRLIRKRLSDPFPIWNPSHHKKAILTALSCLDDAWGSNDLSTFQETIEEIEGLLSESSSVDLQETSNEEV